MSLTDPIDLSAEPSTLPGIYRGSVSDNNDPKGEGRIKVTIPSIFGDAETDWAYPMGFLAGPNRGGIAIPNKKDTVWVFFEHGNPGHPVWTHGWWKENEMPEEAKGELGEKKTLFRSRDWTVLIDDTDGSEKILICDKDNAENLLFEIRRGNNGLIQMKAPNKIELLASKIDLGGTASTALRGGVQTELTHPVCMVTGLPIGSSKSVKAYGE